MIYNRSLRDFYTSANMRDDQLIPFLLGRNAFNYLIKSLKIKAIILPTFICPIVVDIFKNSGIKIFFYSNLDNCLEVPIKPILELVSKFENTDQSMMEVLQMQKNEANQ